MAAETARENGNTSAFAGGEAGVRIPVTRGQIERTYRDGDDLVVVVAGGETLRVKGFFAADGPSESALILNAAAPDEGYEVAEVSAEGRIVGTVEMVLGQLEEMFGRRSSDSAEGQDGDGTFSPERSMGLSPMAIGAPLGLLVAGAAIGGGGGGDDGGGGGSSLEPSRQPQPENQPAYQPAPAPAPATQPETPAPQQSQKQVQPSIEQPAPQPAVQPQAESTSQPVAQQFQPAETPQIQRATAPQPQQGPGEVEIDTSGAGRFEFDDDGDGTVDRIVERIDSDRDGRFEEVTTELFTNGVRDSRTYEQDIDDDGDFDQRDVYRYNGKGQLVRLERDEYADGILDSVVTHAYHANGTTESTEYDLQADGIFERKLTFSPVGHKVREEVDTDNDGRMDRIDTWSHHANGTVERHDTDYQNDGAIDKSVSYDSSGRKVRRAHDPDADGTKETTEWSYHGDGRVVARERTDSDSDGNFERTRADADADRRWDWIGHDSDDDGQLDRVEVIDGDVFASGLGPALAAELAGVETIDLSGGGAAVLALTDGDLTGLAGAASDYALAIDGGSGDTVRFGDSGVYDTGRSSGVYREYRGSDGRVLVKTGVSAEGVQNPLDALRENLAVATAEMFGLAGIQGVTVGNLAAVKSVIGAYGGGVASLSLAQLRNLVEVATDGIAVPANGTLEAARLVQDGLELDIGTDSDAAIEQRVTVSLDSSSLAPAAAVRNIDTDSDGTRDDRRETDSDYDGTADRVETWTHHTNGTVERHAIDSDGDSTVDVATTYDSGGRRVRLESDSDGDGTKETTVWTYHASEGVERERVDDDSDGNFERTSVDIDADGSWDWVGHDADDDGDLDRVEMVDGDAFAAGIATGALAEFVGVGTIDLNGPDGMDVLTLTDGDLTGLAGKADGYALTIDGGSGDTVRFADSGIHATDVTSTDESGNEYREYRGTSGRILVDSDIGVTGAFEDVEEPDLPDHPEAPVGEDTPVEPNLPTQPEPPDDSPAEPASPAEPDSLAALLANLVTATVEMFEQAGVTGVNGNNLNDAKMVIGAYGPHIMSLTLGQVQGLADIASVGVAVSPDGNLLAAVNDAVSNRDGLDRKSNATHRHWNSETIQMDFDADGTYERVVVLADCNFDGTYDVLQADTYSQGIWISRIRQRDLDVDGSFDWNRITAYNAEGWSVWRRTDTNGDGTLENIRIYRYLPSIDGERLWQVYTDDDVDGWIDTERTNYDCDSDGTIDSSELLEFNASRQPVRYSIDSNADGTPERIETYQYEQLAGGGRVKQSQIDVDADGTVDIVERSYYEGSNAQPDYIVYDAAGIGGRSDGTADRLEYRDSVDFEHRIDGSDARLAGISDIDLSGQGGAITLTLTDNGLTSLAAGTVNYHLIIDGEDDDTVRFADGNVQATEYRFGSHDLYLHTSGRILVDSDIEVVGATESSGDTDPLAMLLANLAAATVEMFQQAGITGVNEGNLGDVKMVIGACGFRIATMTMYQVQNLADIVSTGIAVRVEEDLLSAVAESGIMILELSVDSDAEIEQREKSVTLNLDSSTLIPISMSRAFVLDNHYWNLRIEKDSNYNGTVDSISMVDVDPESGKFVNVVTDVFVDGVRVSTIWEDIFTSDGVLRKRTVKHFDDSGNAVSYALYNHLGETDWVLRWAYHDNGNLKSEEFGSDYVSVTSRDLFDTSGRPTRSEQYEVSGRLAGLRTYTYHDDGHILEVDEYSTGGRHRQPDGVPEFRSHGDTNGWRVLEEFDTDYDGTMDLTKSWSNDDNGLAVQCSTDRNADGTIDRVVHFGRNESGEKIYLLVDDSPDGTWDKLVYLKSHHPQRELDVDFAEQISGITEIEILGPRSTTLTLTDEALSVLAGESENYSIEIGGTGRRHATVDLRSGGIERITGDGATDADGRHGYQGTDAILYIDPDITVLV